MVEVDKCYLAVLEVAECGVLVYRGACDLGSRRNKANCSVALILWLLLGTSQKKRQTDLGAGARIWRGRFLAGLPADIR